MGIKIETAEPKDWQIIQSLNNQVFIADKNHDDDLDMNWPFSKAGINYYKELCNGKYGHCFIANVDGKSVGYVALAPKDFGYRKSKYIEVENIGVNPEYRSQGIGRLLIAKAVKWAKEKNATKLYVSAYWQNKKALNFYIKNGFYKSGVELDKKI